MTDEGVARGLPARDGGPRKVGWYRDRTTGRRQFWNGTTWLDLADAITTFTVESEPTGEAPSVPTSTPPTGSGTRAKVITLTAVVAVAVVVALGLALDMTHEATARPSHRPSPPSLPAYSSASSPSGATTAPDVAPATTALSPAPVGTAPPTTTAGVRPALTARGVQNPTATATNLAIIGDSISELATSALDHTFRHYDLFIDAVGGTRMADHLPTIERVESDGLPRDWVIELGTNDALRAPVNLNWASDFANEVAALQTQNCVIFLTVDPRLGPISVGIDDAIAAAVAAHPNFHALDWGTIEFHKPQWLIADHIHPSGSGIAELAKLEHKAVLGCQGG
jgi:hypothetical protein